MRRMQGAERDEAPAAAQEARCTVDALCIIQRFNDTDPFRVMYRLPLGAPAGTAAPETDMSTKAAAVALPCLNRSLAATVGPLEQVPHLFSAKAATVPDAAVRAALAGVKLRRSLTCLHAAFGAVSGVAYLAHRARKRRVLCT